MIYHFKVHREKKGYWAECIELEGCDTEGENLEALKDNAIEALNGYLSEPEDSRVLFPMPRKNLKSNKNIIEIIVDPQVAFAMKLRQERIKCGLTQKQAAERLQIKNIYAYQKLEKYQSANPGLLTLAKIKKVFPNFQIDELIED